MKRYAGLCAVVALLLTGALEVSGQESSLPQTDMIASAEAYGAALGRPDVVADLPARWEQPRGSSERVCVDVTREMTTVRSGEIVIGGFLSQLRAQGPNKVWWKPLNSSLSMTIHLTSRSLDGEEGRIEFDLGPPTSTYTDDRPPQPIPSEAFFPGGAYFPTSGRWIVVANSGENWGCFVFDIPSSPPPPLGG